MKRNTMSIALSGIFALTLPQPAGANTLTGLIPAVYEALDVVSRELIGFIPAVSRDSNAERAAVGQAVEYPVAPAATASDITPGVTAPNDGDQTIGKGSLTISKSRGVPFRWNGEEEKSIAGSVTRAAVQLDQIVQALRTLGNEIEVDLWAAAYKGASRAYGTPGTTPFGTASDMTDLAEAFKILDDNGAPKYNRHIALGTTAMAKIRGKQSNLFKVNEAGTAELLRDGSLTRLMGWGLNDSAAVASVTKGTGASYTSNTAGYAVGATAITLITGTGTVLAGDVVTFAGDTNKYVVATALTGGVIVLAKPGLRQALAASAVAMTVENSSTRNVGFCKNAIQLVARQPALPKEGDMADDRMEITDPHSGLTFELALYKQYRQVRYEVALAWGVGVPKAEHVMILLG